MIDNVLPQPPDQIVRYDFCQFRVRSAECLRPFNFPPEWKYVFYGLFPLGSEKPVVVGKVW